MKLTSKERLTRLYYHKETDRPGLLCREGLIPKSDPTYKSLLELIYAQADRVFGFDLRTLETKPEVRETFEDYSEDFTRCVREMKTPAGVLRQHEMLGKGGKPAYFEKHWLADEGDIEKYLSLPDPDFVDNFEAYSLKLKEAGETGIVVVGFTNPGGFAAELLGTENFAMMSITARDQVKAIMERETRLIIRSLKKLTERFGATLVQMSGQEYITPPLHGPEDFKDFNLTYDKRLIGLVHEAGGAVQVHCHGSVKKVLSLFLESGVDVLHPFEAPPMGDITPAEAKAVIGDRITFEGNIQIADMYEKSPANIREQTEHLIKTIYRDNKGLIVSPTAAPYMVGEGGKCFENYKTIFDIVTG